MSALRVMAGPIACERLLDRGLVLDDFDVIVAPAGGTKFLLTGSLDRVLFPALLRSREKPLHAIGASIGAMRLACLASRDPAAAIARLGAAFTSKRPEPRGASLDAIVGGLVDVVLDGESRRALVAHSAVRLHLLATLCRGLLARDGVLPQMLGFGATAILNAISREKMGALVDRVVYHTGGGRGPLARADDIFTHDATLDADNLRDVLVASAAIPFFVTGKHVLGGPRGVHRDAAIVDYHPALPLERSDGLVLYPHFYPHVTPGFFDAPLGRRAAPEMLARAVILAPSDSHIATLPNGRRPNRLDMHRYSDEERARRWSAIWARGAALGEELTRCLESKKRLAEIVEPISLDRDATKKDCAQSSPKAHESRTRVL